MLVAAFVHTLDGAYLMYAVSVGHWTRLPEPVVIHCLRPKNAAAAPSIQRPHVARFSSDALSGFPQTIQVYKPSRGSLKDFHRFFTDH